jgi:hypothetical protein
MHALTAWRRTALVAGLPLAVSLAVTGPAAAHPADGLKLHPAAGLKVRTTGYKLGTARTAASGTQPFLAGLTSQQQPILLRFNADGSVLARALTTLRLKCTSGASFYLPDGFTSLDVTSLRHFRTSYSLPPANQDATTAVALSGSMTGQIDRTASKASGTWRMTAVETNPTTKAVTDTCASGLVHFSVHR